jgi:hypothetical protein
MHAATRDSYRSSSTPLRRIAIALGVLMFASLASATSVRTDPLDMLNALFPSNRYTVPDGEQLTGLRVALPKPDCSIFVSDCEDLDVINQLDGFNVQPRIVIPFTDAIDLSTVTPRSVFLIEADRSRSSPRRIALNQLQWDLSSNTLIGTPDELLQQHRRYLLIVTDDVRDTSGARIESASFWASETAGARTDAARRYANALRQAVRAAGLRPEHLVAASLFSTQSVTADLEKIQAQIRSTTPQPIDFFIGIDTKAETSMRSPSRAVFAIESLAEIKWHRQSGTGTGSEPMFADDKVFIDRLALSPGSVAKIAFGRFFSPEYRSTGNAIPTYPTGNGQPPAERLVPLIVEIFIPAGPKPSRGWPVALVGHGITGDVYSDPWAIAPQLAAAGIATAAIHYANHGGGERGTLELVSRDGGVVVVPSGGRGIDQDGDGRISPVEGLYAVRPKALLFGRDGTRQTVIDLMQLVREIQIGVDVDGDGYPDLDPARISYVGHSGGSIYGTVLLAVEPSIRVGALVCVGGPSVDLYRLGSSSLRRIIGSVIAARKPSLINGNADENSAKPSFEFVDNIPLRDRPIAVHSTPGAMETQRLLDRMSWAMQSANPVAYAPYLRESPLPRHPRKQILIQFAKGDRSVVNPVTTAVIRAGRLADRTTLYRADLAQTTDPRGMPKNPHNYIFEGVDRAERPFALAAQMQIVIFLKSSGSQTIDPDGDGPIFETPIAGPLPEQLNFVP